ncbi:hypothetical protein SAY87_016084 [Trapa incisa]|uniref:Uncharacterized protein n=2 Tax=Trapa TaxID=22665 RepID=A0AAN7LK16_TRANT|nr:hypothetical protein SAY87_016084 [Trapa incisa]KAK4785624.1 hypothetical protein SAY86_002313 [Trapa natans]
MMMMIPFDDNGGSSSEHGESGSHLREDFIGSLRIDDDNHDAGDLRQRAEVEDDVSEHSSRDCFESGVSIDLVCDEEDEEEGEFEFVCVNPDGSPISADDIFEDGKIRPVYPLFDRSILFGDSQDGARRSTEGAPKPRQPLKKLFLEMAETDELEGVEEGTYCVWKGKAAEEATSKSDRWSRKSNSTGFSRRWRFRDLVCRTNSDGKDAFVFLSSHRLHGGGGKIHQASKGDGGEKSGRTAASKEVKAQSTAIVTAAAAEGKGKGHTAHEKHYVRSRAAKESERRRSYLPYRQDLVGLGFFANVSSMTRNVHPF